MQIRLSWKTEECKTCIDKILQKTFKKNYKHKKKSLGKISTSKKYMKVCKNSRQNTYIKINTDLDNKSNINMEKA